MQASVWHCQHNAGAGVLLFLDGRVLGLAQCKQSYAVLRLTWLLEDGSQQNALVCGMVRTTENKQQMN